MQQKLIKRTAVFSLIFFLVSMGTIFRLSADKVIVIDNVSQDEVNNDTAVKEAASEGTRQNLTFQLGEADTSYLRIPLPEGCKADDITIENHYMTRELWIMVPGEDENFYAEHSISGNRKAVREGTFDIAKEGIILYFGMTGVYECRTILENENLYISFQPPKEIYDKIVVIDPACGGIDTGYTSEELAEKDITLLIARKLKAKLDESDIKAYYTRMDDINPSGEERIALGNEVKADMYIRIEVNGLEDSSVYGTEAVYNSAYFIPGFGNVELADALEREVVTAIKGKALGLKEAEGEDYELSKATVPAAVIRVGCLSNAQEAILLGREEYSEKIATGIYNAIIKVYQENIG